MKSQRIIALVKPVGGADWVSFWLESALQLLFRAAAGPKPIVTREFRSARDVVLRVREGVALTWDRSPFVFAAGMEHAIIS